MQIRNFIVAGLVLALSSSAAIAADMSSPKATLKGFAQAIKSGDKAAAKTFVVDEPKEQEAADLALSFILPVLELDNTMQAKYGQGLSSEAGGFDQDAFSDELIDKAEVEVDGDSALVTNEEGSETELTKVDGNWKITMAGQMPPEEQMDMAKRVSSAMGTAANNIAEGVKSGQYATADEASNAFQFQMQQVMQQIMMEEMQRQMQQQGEGGMQGGGMGEDDGQ